MQYPSSSSTFLTLLTISNVRQAMALPVARPIDLFPFNLGLSLLAKQSQLKTVTSTQPARVRNGQDYFVLVATEVDSSKHHSHIFKDESINSWQVKPIGGQLQAFSPKSSFKPKTDSPGAWSHPVPFQLESSSVSGQHDLFLATSKGKHAIVTDTEGTLTIADTDATGSSNTWAVKKEKLIPNLMIATFDQVVMACKVPGYKTVKLSVRQKDGPDSMEVNVYDNDCTYVQLSMQPLTDEQVFLPNEWK